jgi:hypothetical protein
VVPILIEQPKNWSLTEQDCLDRNQQPLYVGDYVEFRFQLLNEAGDDAVNLDDPSPWLLEFEITGPDGTTTIKRSSAVDLAGQAGLKQLGADAGQGTGDENASTGKGWYSARFAPGDAPQLMTVLGRGKYRARLTPGGSTRPQTHVRGPIDVVFP